MDNHECDEWEQLYRSGDMPWEKGYAAPPLLEWLDLHGPLTGDIIVPGCGYGHDVRAIAARSRNANVVGFDISPTAIAEARRFPKIGNESYQVRDLLDLSNDLYSTFDWVVEHTCFCVLSPEHRCDYVTRVASLLRSDGLLLAIFFLDPWDPGEMPEAGGPPFGVTPDELNRLFGSRFQVIEEIHPKTAYPGRQGKELIRLLRKHQTV